MKKIVIDCRYLSQSGLGRVVQGILENLFNYSRKYSFLLLGNQIFLKKYECIGKILSNNTSAFSMGGLLLSSKQKTVINQCDVFLTPGYIVPLGISIPCAVFIDDCIPFDVQAASNNLRRINQSVAA